jgi:hypothetical protein
MCVSGVARRCGRGGAARYDARRASSLPRRRAGGSDVRARGGRGGWHPLPLPQAHSGWVLGRWRVEFPPAQIRQKSTRTARWWLARRASKKVARAEVLAGKGERGIPAAIAWWRRPPCAAQLQVSGNGTWGVARTSGIEPVNGTARGVFFSKTQFSGRGQETGGCTCPKSNSKSLSKYH